MSVNKRIALVSGANKGIGFAIVQGLLAQSDSTGPLHVLMGARDNKRGEDSKIKVRQRPYMDGYMHGYVDG